MRSILWRDIFWFLVGKAIKGKQKIKTASRDQNPGSGNKMVEAQRPSEKHGDGSKGPGGHSANLEVIFAGL